MFRGNKIKLKINKLKLKLKLQAFEFVADATHQAENGRSGFFGKAKTLWRFWSVDHVQSEKEKAHRKEMNQLYHNHTRAKKIKLKLKTK